jgi:hypothetical protein
MRNSILALFVASGMLLVGSAAYGTDGTCQGIGARLIGASNQISEGINIVNNCNTVMAVGDEFNAAGCDPVDDTGIGVALENGESCNNTARLCDTLFTCFNFVPDYCVDVAECTIP